MDLRCQKKKYRTRVILECFKNIDVLVGDVPNKERDHFDNQFFSEGGRGRIKKTKTRSKTLIFFQFLKV